MMNLWNKPYVKKSVAILGVISAFVTISAFIIQITQQSKTVVQFEIVTNSNVLDINTNISKLDIIYDSTSLKHHNQNLQYLVY